MKIKTIALILAFPFFAFGQKNLSIDVVGGIEYSYRAFSGKDDLSGFLLDIRDREEGKINWRAGFNFNQRLTNKIYLKLGMRLASIGYKGEKMTDLRWGSEFDGMGGWNPDPSLPHELQLIKDYLFIDLPIVGRYEFNQKKLAFFVETGIAPAFYLTTRTKSITDISTEKDFNDDNDFDGFNQIHITGLISFGVNYSMNEQWQIFGQPIFRYHFTSLYDSVLKEHLYNAGLELGIRRKL